jgi:hypothetical protein
LHTTGWSIAAVGVQHAAHTCADAQAQTGTHGTKSPRACSFEFLLPALHTHTTLPEILLLAAAKMPKSPVTFPLMYAEAQLRHQHSQRA